MAAAVLSLSLLTMAPTAVAARAASLVDDPASLVNPFIGTSNKADDFPGADAPFGMVQWSPDTPSRPYGGGYEYKDSAITGFSLTHLSGPGCQAMGDIPVLPTTGSVDMAATAGFSHTGESADAGYYSVGLNTGIRTELTATTRSGMARFTFPATSRANLLFKLAGSQTSVSATTFTKVSGDEVAGSVTTGHFCGTAATYTVYFDAVFDHPFTTSGTAALPSAAPGTTTSPVPGGPAVTEPDNAPAYHGPSHTGTATPSLTGPSGAYLTFDTTGDQVVQAKIGLSYVSTANAKANRSAENAGWDFDATRQATHNAWNALLGRIRVGGGTTDQQHVFYTALYHALLHPNVASDSNGQYLGFDHKVHTLATGQKAQYANYSGWDIYRSQAQLEALVAPQQAGDSAQSMVNDYLQSGLLPKWSLNNGETYVMVGDPADSIIADYYAFGARTFDTHTALTAMVHSASVGNKTRPGLLYLDNPGYLPSNGSYGCCNFYGNVSTQLEYDTADFALSSYAGALGDTADQKTYLRRAQDWAGTFDAASGFMQPKLANGGWAAGFSPSAASNFVEGTSWQYTGMVPFDIAGLAVAHGGAAGLRGYLDHVLAGFTGAGGSQANLGNEPSLELPWEYDYLGQPYRTQQVVRQVQDSIWKNSPAGLAGNDDLGTMSAWYVWSALGMYPETPGTADLALGSPVFPQTVLTLGDGNQLTVNAPQAADSSPYVRSLAFNGSAWNDAYAPPSALTAGGTLDYVLGGTANTAWATASSAAPPSYGGSGGSAGAPRAPIASGFAGKCVDDNQSGVADGTHIQLWNCNGTNAQRWTAASDGSLRTLGKCMDVALSGTANGTLVRLWDCNGTGAQKWTATGGALVNAHSGKCLDLPHSNTANGTQLQIYTCNRTTAQKWKLNS